MATSLTCSALRHRSPSINLPADYFSGKFRTIIVATAKSDHHTGKLKTEEIMRGAIITSEPKRPWWAPIFNIGRDLETNLKTQNRHPVIGEERQKVANRSAFTAEKARLLRKEMRAAENWHDPMYHSAIASRLASPDHK